jgi:hypothetical protein
MAPRCGIQPDRLVTNGPRFALQRSKLPLSQDEKGTGGCDLHRAGPLDALRPAVDRRSGSRPKQLFEDTCAAPDRRAGKEAI